MENQEFILDITGAEHGEWQGCLTLANGDKEPFRSLLELVKMIDQELERRV